MLTPLLFLMAGSGCSSEYQLHPIENNGDDQPEVIGEQEGVDEQEGIDEYVSPPPLPVGMVVENCLGITENVCPLDPKNRS